MSIDFGENHSTGSTVVSLFLKFLGYTDLSFKWMKLQKNLHTKYISLEITIMQFEYT